MTDQCLPGRGPRLLFRDDPLAHKVEVRQVVQHAGMRKRSGFLRGTGTLQQEVRQEREKEREKSAEQGHAKQSALGRDAQEQSASTIEHFVMLLGSAENDDKPWEADRNDPRLLAGQYSEARGKCWLPHKRKDDSQQATRKAVFLHERHQTS